MCPARTSARRSRCSTTCRLSTPTSWPAAKVGATIWSFSTRALRRSTSASASPGAAACRVASWRSGFTTSGASAARDGGGQLRRTHAQHHRCPSAPADAAAQRRQPTQWNLRLASGRARAGAWRKPRGSAQPLRGGRAAAEAFAARVAAEDGVRMLAIDELQVLLARASTETVYPIDVRTRDEYRLDTSPASGGSPEARRCNGPMIRRPCGTAVSSSAAMVRCGRR